MRSKPADRQNDCASGRVCAGMRRLRWRWLLYLCVGMTLAAGCIRAVPYQPDERLVDTLGVTLARQRLQDILKRSINPQIISVDVTDNFLAYRYRHDIAGVPTGATLENRIHFLNVVTVEVYTNDVVIVRTASNITLAQFIFGNPQDPKALADLLASFRVWRARRG